MVMENEIRLGDIMDKLTPSDRVVIYNAARRKSSGTAEDKATMQSTVPGAGICDRRRGNSWRIYLPGSFRNQEL